MGNFSTYLRTMLSACLILSGVQLFGQNNTESLNYCKNITTNGYTTGIGFSAMAFGGTTYTPYSGAGTQVYYENMNQFLGGGVNAGSSTMSYSYTTTATNERVRIWVDWNKNGVFNDVTFAGPNNGGELMHNSGVIGVAGTVMAGTINVPFGVPAGVYRLRIAGDVGGNPTPCALTTSGVVIDYQIVIKNATTTDAAITRPNLPTNFASITNMPAISLWARNIGTSVVPSGSNVVIGYSVNGGTPTTATVAIASNWAVGSELAITSATLMTGLVSGEVNRIQSWIETVNGVAPPTTNNDSLVWFTFFASAVNNMSGSYTVDRTTTGTRNFPTIQHALNALQTAGVAGATTINVAANTYWENPNILLAIPGTSAVNTVTIQGADTSNTIIRPAISPTNYYGVLLANCSFVTFRNFKIRRDEATSSSSSNILLQMRATTSCNVRRNSLEYRGAAHAIGGTASTSGNYSGLALSGSTSNFSGMTTGTPANLCNIDSNSLDFANYYGIISAVTTAANTNTFSRNTIINQYFYPLYIQGTQGFKILNNFISPRITLSSTTGIYVSGGTLTTTTMEIGSNIIQNAGQYGIRVLLGSNPTNAKGSIYNNMISGFRQANGAGIYLQTSYWKVAHNSINYNFAGSNSYGIYVSSFGEVNNSVRIWANNIAFPNSGSYTSWPIYITSISNQLVDTMDYNNIFTAATPPNMAYLGGTTLTTASNYKLVFPAMGIGANTTNTNPNYISATDLHTRVTCNNSITTGMGANLYRTTDIDGDAVGSTPDVGADESTNGYADEVGVVSITTPGSPIIPGSGAPCQVVIKNYGTATWNTGNISYSNNGATTTEAIVALGLAPCASTNYTFATNPTMVAGNNVFKVFTDAPNGGIDSVANNDTAQFNLCGAMSGTYTIDPAGSGPTNFTSFAAATAALVCAGANGPITFNVANGTYNENVVLPQITGTSATNKIRFRSASGNPALCIINANVNSLSAAIDLNGADWVTFDRFTINNNFNSTAYGVWFRNGAHRDSISNCILNGFTGNINFYGFYQSNTRDTFNTIIGNTVNNGGYGIYMQSSTTLVNGTYSQGNAFIGNNLINQYYYGIYSYYQDSVAIIGNNISTSTSLTTYYGIYTTQNARRPLIIGNKITITTGVANQVVYGMDHSGLNISGNQTIQNRGYIANNMVAITGTFALGTSYGMRLQSSCNYNDVYYNSVNITAPNTGSYAAYFGSFMAGDTVRNNVFMNPGGGTAATSGFAAYLYPNGTSMHYNNNVYGSLTSGTFLFWNGGAYTNTQAGFLSYRTAANTAPFGNCENPAVFGGSYRSLIGFTSKTDLHTNGSCSADNGFWSTYNASKAPLFVDFDGAARSATPDRGCDEYATTNAFDASVYEITAPTTVTIGLPTTVQFRVRNSGTTAINQLTMNYTVNGGSLTTQSFPVNLQPCEYSDTLLSFTVQATFAGGGTNVLKVFASSINTGNPDGNNANDTGVRTYALPYAGVYTINKNQPLSTTNFTSFNEAFTMIRTGTVAGPVTLNVVSGSGPYNEQLTITNPIIGMNSINKITVDGGGTKEMIWFNTTINNQQAVIRIVNARNFIFKNLTINNPNITNCVGVLLTTNADSNIIQDCNINLASTSASNSAGIAICSNSTFVTGSGANSSTTLLTGNRIRGGYFGITAYGTSTANLSKRLSIVNNFISNTYNAGVNLYYYDSSDVTGNNIDTCSPITSLSAVNIQYCDFTHFRKNKVNNFYYYGLNMYQVGQAAGGTGLQVARCEFSNNMIGGSRSGNSFGYAVYNYYPRNVDFIHNTIGYGTNTQGGYPFYMYSTQGLATSTGNVMLNNNIYMFNNSGGDYSYIPYSVSPFTTTGFNYNNFYSDINATIYLGNNVYTGTAYIGASVQGHNTSNSWSVNPQLINEFSNLHTFNPILNDQGTTTFVTTDIDGDTRPIGGGSVDIGADEYTPPAENIGVTALVAPTQFPAGGLQDVTVTFKNFGLVAITSADVSYKAGNLGTLHTIGWTGTLAPGSSTNVTFTGAMQYNNIGNNDTLISFTSNPNGTTDGYQLNDTLNSYLCGGAMAGVYTVDAGLPASSTNFQTIDAMITKLNSCGVSAATTVNIANGTYTGQWTLTPISGVNASAPLTIQSASGNPANVTLTFNGQTSYANNHILFLNGADFIKLRNMTFTTTNATWGGLLKIIFDARDNKVEGCVFNTTASTSTATGSPSHACVDMAEGATGDNYRDTVTNCTMNNGSVGIILTAPARYNYGVVFTNNTMNNQYFAGIYHTWANSSGNPVVMSGNTITTNTSYTGFYGIYCTSSSSMLQYFNKNKVLNPNGGYGIYNTNTVAAGSQCNNNMLMVGGSSTCYPLYISGGNWNIYNNSTMAASSLVGTYYSAYLPSSPNTIRHNIFAVSGGNACIYSPSANSVDSNIYYTTGATFGSNGTTYATFAAWKAAMPTRDLASIHSNPNFVSNTNLHLTGSSPAYTINTHPMIVDDIDNLPRCGTSQAGCDHLGGNNDIGIASLIYPPNGVASAGSQTIKVLLKNFGTNTVTSANVYYNINGTEVKQAWTGSLGLCATDTVTFTTPYTFAPGAITIKTWTDSPSTVVDSRIANDSFNINGCIGLSGAMTINASLPASSTNYQSFTAAVAAMTGCGISGPVVFTVAPGSYYEQIVIPLIPGSSAVNTVTFDGVDRNTRSINFFTSPGSEYIIRLSGTSHIYFKNLSILSSNQSVAWNVHALNCGPIGFNKCIIGDTLNQFFNATPGSTLSRIVINGSTTSLTGAYTSGAGPFTCDSSILHFAYYVVTNYVSNGNHVTNLRNNDFDNLYYMGVYAPSNCVLKFKNNAMRFRVRTIGQTTHYAFYVAGTPSSPNFHEVVNNRFDSLYSYGAYLVGAGNPAPYKNVLANNTFSRGINFASATTYLTMISATNSNWNIFHNSYNLNNNNSNAYGLYVSFGANNTIKNNIFACTNTNGTLHYPLYISSSTYVDSMNYNIFYNVASSNLAYMAGANWTQANLGTAWPTGLGVNSKYANPGFVSTSNLHVNSSFICSGIAPNVGITTDMDNQSRGGTTTIGADEATAVTNDLGIDSLLSPATLSITPGVMDIRVRVRNTGSNSLISGNVNLVLNGTPTTLPLPGTLAPCDTVTITFPAQTFIAGFNTMLIYTSAPNASADNNTSNDSLYNLYCSSIAGTFTIDKTSPIGPTNFPSIASAINAIYSCGISGPVTFNILSGTGPYNEQNIFNGVVPGSSPTNTITIDGGATKETVQFQGPSQGSAHVFRLIGAKWITLKNMTVKTLDPNWGTAFQLSNGSDSNTVKGNNIIITGAMTDTRNCGIALNGLGTTPTTFPTSVANISDYNTIDSNTITGGYYAIVSIGWSNSTGSQAESNIITNNICTGMYQYGCYMYYQHGLKFNGNTLTMSPSAVISNYGLFAYYWDGFEFKRNKINNAGTYGVYFLSPGQAGGFNGSDSFEISNNMIGGNFLSNGTIYGMYITNTTFLYRARIMNNTISITPPVSNVSQLFGIYFPTGYNTNGYWDNNIFKNNSVSLFGAASSSFPVYIPFSGGLTPTLPFSIGGVSQMDNNNFFTSDPSGNTAYIQATTYTLNNFVGASGMNVNSKNLNPVFINNLTNLHTISPNLNALGTPISYITTDIDGQARNATTPDIGADEFDVAAENIGAFAVVSPSFPMTAGLQNVVINIKNFGTVPVTSANVRYKVGALGTIKTIAWTGTLAIGGNTNITFTGANQYNFAGGFDTIYAWTDGPNGTTDGYQLNDSITNVVCSPLSGTYTVNASSPASITNFQNFTSLKDRLTSCGVSGPVVVNVATGVYTEQMQIGEISGASPTNTITIQSAALNADSVVIQFNSASNTTNNYVIDLNGADYFRFHHLTLSNAISVGFNGVVIMRNTARANQFTNNKMYSNGSLSTSSNQVVFYVLSNTNALSDDSLVLRKNLFNSGSYGLYVLSSTQPKYNYFVDSNTFTNQQYMRINVTNLRNSVFTNNIINCNSAYSLPYGMLFQTCNASGANFVISKNKLTGNAYYGLFLSSCFGTLANPFVVTNNFLMSNGANGSNGAYVLYGSSIGGCKIYNNSILSTIGSTGMYTAYLPSISTPVNHFKHNIVYAKGSGTVSPYVLYLSTTNPSNILIDSNVYFQGTGAAGFAAITATQATFAAYKTTMNGIGQEDYSVYTNPLFVSNTDLHTTSPTNLLSIMTNDIVNDDIDNANRSGLSDAGADHHPLANDLGVESIVYPNAGVAGAGLRDIKFVIRNYGVNTITSSTVGYNVDGHIETKPWTGSLATGQRDTITFNGAQQHNFIGTIFSMSAWVDSISPLIYNDTLYTYGCIGLAGTYTIGGTPGPTNFTNFTSAVNAMAGCGISGPVTFNVAPGDYTEQVDIPAISGQSAANTITFDGGNPLTTQLRFACTGFTPGNYVLRFNGTNYVTFRNLAISNTTNTSTSSNILVFNSTNIRIVKCMIGDNNTTPGSVSGQSSTASLYRIALTGNATNPGTASVVNHNIFIDSNIINFGYYGIWSAGNLPTAKIYTTNNIFNGQYLYDAYYTGSQVPYIFNNFFNTRTAGSLTTSHSSIYLTGVIPAVTEKIEIYKNTIDSFNGTAIYLGSSGIAANYNMCVNNVIYGNFGAGTVYGIQAPVQYWRYLHNTINLGSNGVFGGYCLYVTSTLNDCRNNVFTITATGLSTSIPVYASSAAAFNNFNYNMFFNGTNGNVLQIGAFTYTQANFQAPYSGGAGANSVWANPNYASPTNMHLSTALGCTIAGTPAGITTDMDGQTRSLLAPTIGADEVVRLATDLAVENITNPSTSSQPAGPATVAVLVRNVGNNQITSGNISAQLNYNGTVFTVAFTDTINPCDTHTLFIPGVVFGGSGNPVDTLKVFSDGPNGTTDNNLLNDTTRRIICGPLNGTYTIGGASPDFVSIATALAQLSCGGVSGPVKFNIRTGTYNGPFLINPVIGSSTTNTVTFTAESGNAADVIIAKTINAAYVVRVNGADNIIFDKLTIRENTSWPNTVISVFSTLPDSASNITISNCILNNAVASNSVSYSVVSSTGFNPGLTIRKNTITRSQGINIVGNNNVGNFNPRVVIDSNTFNTTLGENALPIFMSFCWAPKIRYNTINAVTASFYQMISLTNVSGPGEISYNSITNGGSSSPIVLNLINNYGETTPFTVYNNFVNSTATSTTLYQMSVTSSSYVNIYHNSFRYTTTLTANRGLLVTNNNGFSSNVRIVNNIFQTTGANVSCIYFNGTNLATAKANIAECNYNNYYQGSGSASEPLINVFGSNYTFATMKGILYGGSDSNSVFGNPGYISATNLRLSISAVGDGRAKFIPSITNDYDQKLRPVEVRDMGADDTMFIRYAAGDYTSVNCANLSGVDWINMYDTTGKLIFAINPNGNNLGATCWSIRVRNTSDSVRKDSISNTVSGLKEYCMMLDRNLVITPTNQPTNGRVYIRFYVRQAELNKLYDTILAKWGVMLNDPWVKVHKFHQASGPEGLTPLTNAVGADSSTFIAHTGATPYGVDKYFQYSVPGFSQQNLVIPQNNPFYLPVTWTSFTAKAVRNDAVLDWTTSSEKNNDRFEVERSFDGKNFEFVTSLKGAGNSKEVKMYNTIDKDVAFKGQVLVYYRIKQVDFDGKYEYSEIKTVSFAPADRLVVTEINPNPFKDYVNVQFTLPANELVEIKVTDIGGATVKTVELKGTQGVNARRIELPGLAAGAYFIKVKVGDTEHNAKLIKE